MCSLPSKIQTQKATARILDTFPSPLPSQSLPHIQSIIKCFNLEVCYMVQDKRFNVCVCNYFPVCHIKVWPALHATAFCFQRYFVPMNLSRVEQATHWTTITVGGIQTGSCPVSQLSSHPCLPPPPQSFFAFLINSFSSKNQRYCMYAYISLSWKQSAVKARKEKKITVRPHSGKASLLLSPLRAMLRGRLEEATCGVRKIKAVSAIKERKKKKSQVHQLTT